MSNTCRGREVQGKERSGRRRREEGSGFPLLAQLHGDAGTGCSSQEGYQQQ